VVDGADELFAGYEFSVMDGVCSRSPAHAAQVRGMLERARNAWAQETGFDLRVCEIPQLGSGDEAVPFLLQSWNYGRCIFWHLLSAELLDQFSHVNPYTRLYEEATAGAGNLRGLRRSLTLWRKSLFVSHILAAERLDMANSIETRFPFLDNRVAQIAAGLPDELLVHNGQEKYLLRKALEPLLPAAVRGKVKQPFQAPSLACSANTQFSTYLRDTLGSRELRESGIFNFRLISALIERWERLPDTAQQRLDTTMMLILSTCVLGKRFSLH
jgi:asparagine synthase (glutamine-hydrolysing)